MEQIIPSRVSNAGKLLKNAVIALVINIFLGVLVTLIAINNPREFSGNTLTIFGICSLILTVYSIYQLYEAGDNLQESYWESEDETAS
jgi:hypothetical protein